MRGSLATLSALVVAACGDTLDAGKLPPPSRTEAPYTSAFPAVVRLHGSGSCTGVVIQPGVVLTASHCVREGGGALVTGALGRAVSRRIVRHGPGVKGDTRDIALVFLDATGTSDFLPLGDGVALGDEVRLVGYGCGGKRTGTNVVYRIADYIELLSVPSGRLVAGPENRAETCPGDSGSPLLARAADGWRVVGILHAMLLDRGARLSGYIDVTRGANREFLERHLGRE